MINLKEKQYCNFDMTGRFTGKGIKIALLEYYPSKSFSNIKIGNPLNANWKDINGDNEYENHPYMCGAIIRDMLPNATIDYLPQNNDGIKYAIKNNYHIVSFSALECLADDSLEKELAKKSLLFCGAGNSGSNGESKTSTNDWWVSVGAYHLNTNPELAYYSSYGKNAVDVMSFSNIKYSENSNNIVGTSFSTPFAVSLIAQYIQMYFTKFGFYPTVEESKMFIKENSISILNDSVKEGFGLLKLPSYDDYKFGMSMTLNSPYVNINGEIKKFDYFPKLIDNRTYIPIAMLRELGENKGQVNWHPENNSIVVR